MNDIHNEYGLPRYCDVSCDEYGTNWADAINPHYLLTTCAHNGLLGDNDSTRVKTLLMNNAMRYSYTDGWDLTEDTINLWNRENGENNYIDAVNHLSSRWQKQVLDDSDVTATGGATAHGYIYDDDSRMYVCKNGATAQTVTLGTIDGDISDWVGHSVIRTTANIYGHLDY